MNGSGAKAKIKVSAPSQIKSMYEHIRWIEANQTIEIEWKQKEIKKIKRNETAAQQQQKPYAANGQLCSHTHRPTSAPTHSLAELLYLHRPLTPSQSDSPTEGASQRWSIWKNRKKKKKNDIN